MKLLIVGDWHSDLHETELSHSFRRLGHTVTEFGWSKYFKQNQKVRFSLFRSVSKRFQNKYIFGPLVHKLNNDFLMAALEERFDMIFLYRGTHIWYQSLVSVKGKHPNTLIVSYNNDDAFSPMQPKYLWRHFKRCLSICDIGLAYRHINILDYRQAGAKKVDLLRSWYVPDRNFPVDLNCHDLERYKTDIVFVGHYENDLRIECLEAIIKAGYSLRIFGPEEGWKQAKKISPILNSTPDVKPVWGSEYNKALNGAKIALCFFSKLNRDSYTRRCFEIPATNTLMMSEYSDDLAELFEPDKEACFFRDKDELISKLETYVNDDTKRKEVSFNGYKKVMRSGHDIDSRISSFIDKYTNGERNEN